MTRLEPPEAVVLPGSDKIFGMENFGNTCYCNLILQCLYYSDSFRTALLSYGYDPDEKRRHKPEVKGVQPHGFTQKYEQLVEKKRAEQGDDEPKRKGLIFGIKMSLNLTPASVAATPPPKYQHPAIVPAGKCTALTTDQRRRVAPGSAFAQLPVLVTPHTPHGKNCTTMLKPLLMLLAETAPAVDSESPTTARGRLVLKGSLIIVVGIPYPEPNLSTPINPFNDNPSSDHRKKLALINGPIINLDLPLCAKAQPDNLCLLYALRDMYEAVADNKLTTGVVCPLYFVAKLKEKNFLFSQNNMHHDSHEFFNYLMNEIIECVNTEAPGGHNWCNDIFQGEITNETKCLNCETVTLKHENFIDLLVDIPPGLSQSSHSLTHLLNNFSTLEVLTNQNKFYCNTCALLQEAIKTIKLKHLPEVLVINLKRFKYDETVDKLVKLFDLISYPFNLRLFHTTDDDELLVYELYALVVHIGGGPTHGHYVALCKYKLGLWLLFDDETVEVVENLYVMRFFGNSPGLGSAYILFYQRLSPSQQEFGFNEDNVYDGNEYVAFEQKQQRQSPPPKHPSPPQQQPEVVVESEHEGKKGLFKRTFFEPKQESKTENGRVASPASIPTYNPNTSYAPTGDGSINSSEVPPRAALPLAPPPVQAPPPTRKKTLFSRRKGQTDLTPTPEPQAPVSQAPPQLERRKSSVFGFLRKGQQ